MTKKIILLCTLITSMLMMNCTKDALSSLTKVTGKVINSSNTPIANAQVSMADKSVTTDASGIFTFEGVTPGSYTLTVKATGYNDYSNNISISGSCTCSLVNITLSPTSNTTADVYAVGFMANSDDGSLEATLWHNGVKQTLPGDQAYSVFVSGTDVYVAGINGDGAALWKNGVAQTLQGNSSTNASNVFLAGSNVYMAGTAKDANNLEAAAWWKNGALTIFNNPTSSSSYPYNSTNANAVYTSGSTLYVAGNGEKKSTNKPVAILWTNGTPQELSDGTTSSEAFCIYGVGSDVYVGGYISDANNNRIPTIWKNGTKQSLTLPNGYTEAGVRSIFVANGTVYASGYAKKNLSSIESKATYWANGNPSVIPNSIESYSIYVLGNDVYMGGTVFDNIHSKLKPALWVNGTLQVLDNTTKAGYVFGIFVK